MKKFFVIMSILLVSAPICAMEKKQIDKTSYTQLKKSQSFSDMNKEEIEKENKKLRLKIKELKRIEEQKKKESEELELELNDLKKADNVCAFFNILFSHKK